MPYFPPNIGAAGLSVPLFTDIQQALLDAFQSIYGSSTYLGNDSSDFQWITALALKLSDNMSLCQLAYSSRSPLTAIGSALDSVCKINGIARLSASVSTAIVVLTGTPGTPITNGVIQDVNGVLWQMASIVTIGSGGTQNALVACQQVGAVSANANTITLPVGGFTAGWTSVTNPSPATVGTPAEADSAFRARQSVSASLPSSTRLAATQAALEAIPGVTRTNVLENQLSTTDAFGNQGHSLTCVVQGGTEIAIGTAIFLNRGIGCNTQGATVPTMVLQPVTDPNSGNVTVIGFCRPVFQNVFVSVTVHGFNLAFTVQTEVSIKNILVSYLNSLEIGETITQSGLIASAMSINPNISLPIFSVRALTFDTHSSPTNTTDLPMLFFWVAAGDISRIVLTAV